MYIINRIAFLTFLAVVLTTSNAKDDVAYWRRRAQEAKRIAYRAYHPNPISVVKNLNQKVHRSLNGTLRRGLTHRLDHIPCVAVNPVDQCWRCRPNWAQNRQRLADCGLGFGRHTTGGKGGRIYIVTDPSDHDMINPKEGTLRHAVIQDEPLWIIFAHDMVIQLSQELIMNSNKTIDGRGAQIHIINGAGITIQHVHNIIIHNIRVRDIKPTSGGLIRDSTTHYGLRTQSDGDAISIFGSTNIWIDHVSLSSSNDGLIDVIEASTAVTISNCHFTHHNDVLLFGAKDGHKGDKIMQVTLAFNHFGKGLIQRMPRVRWGFVHTVNNDYTMWQMYAIGGSQCPTILSQGNRFYAPDKPFAKEVTKREYATMAESKDWIWRSQGDVLLNGAFFVESGDPNHKFEMGDCAIDPQAGKMVVPLTECAGPLHCVDHKPC